MNISVSDISHLVTPEIETLIRLIQCQLNLLTLSLIDSLLNTYNEYLIIKMQQLSHVHT